MKDAKLMAIKKLKDSMVKENSKRYIKKKEKKEEPEEKMGKPSLVIRIARLKGK